MTTRQRLDLIARAYPRLFPRAELLRLLRAQLGHVDALDRWTKRNGTDVRARAPRLIYHICAGNLAVSAWTSLVHGLLLGAHNVVKLPGDREDSSARAEILGFIKGLPSPLRQLVETNRTFDPGVFGRADAIIVFGSDETMASLSAQARWNQKFIAHGHALSLIWIAEPDRVTTRKAQAIANDILTYDQLGCLSPQSIYVPAKTNIKKLGEQLAVALEGHWQKMERKSARPLAVAARICEARDVAHALGHRVWTPPGEHLGWTLIHDPDPTFLPSPLHGVIYLRQVAEAKLETALASVRGRISTVGLTGEISSRLEGVFLSLGASRFCPVGRMQFPPLTWHHDGRPVLTDLVTWIDREVSE